MKEDDYYGRVRSEIMPLLPAGLDRIFEVGCGAGETLAFLKRTGRCSWAGGIELFHQAAEEARCKGLDLIIEGDIAGTRLPFALQSLDAILCLDVLEHLVDPHAVLSTLHGYLKPGGVVICSIPNVRYFSVTLPLLFRGDWTYTDQGVLDRTHLRFFTKKTAVSLVASAGFRINAVRATGLEKWSKGALVNLLTLNLFRPFLEFQYLVRGEK
jgi:SAM-dependent methyltransferase